MREVGFSDVSLLGNELTPPSRGRSAQAGRRAGSRSCGPARAGQGGAVVAVLAPLLGHTGVTDTGQKQGLSSVLSY